MIRYAREKSIIDLKNSTHPELESTLHTVQPVKLSCLELICKYFTRGEVSTMCDS